VRSRLSPKLILSLESHPLTRLDAREAMNSQSARDTEERVDFSRIWKSVRGLLPRATEKTRSNFTNTLFYYELGLHHQRQVPLSADAKPFDVLANLLKKVIEQIRTMQTLQGARSIDVLPHLFDKLLFGNVSLSIPRFLNQAALLEIAARGQATLIRSGRKDKQGPLTQNDKRELLKNLQAIWRAAGTGKPSTENSRFLDFCESISSGLPKGLKLGTRGALIKMLKRL
jgi:hypothetical protein